jgi:hypothetical protein
MQLYRYFVSQSSEACHHNRLCCFSTSVYCCCCCLFRYDSVRKLLDIPRTLPLQRTITAVGRTVRSIFGSRAHSRIPREMVLKGTLVFPDFFYFTDFRTSCSKNSPPPSHTHTHTKPDMLPYMEKIKINYTYHAACTL